MYDEFVRVTAIDGKRNITLPVDLSMLQRQLSAQSMQIRFGWYLIKFTRRKFESKEKFSMFNRLFRA